MVMGEEDGHIGTALVEAGLITPTQLETALQYQKSIGGRLGRILGKLGYVKEEKLLEFVANQQGLDLVSLKGFDPEERLMKLVAGEFWERHGMVPYSLEGSVLKVAMGDAGDIPAIDELRFTTSLTVVPALASPSEVQTVLNKYLYKDEEGAPSARAHRDIHDVAREIEAQGSVKPPETEAKQLVDGTNPAKLARSLAVLLVQKGVISTHDLSQSLEE
jgi:hypothetical protein